jgi:hypothetical protein
MAVDTSGNVHVTGESLGSSTLYDYVTIAYDTNGDQLWLARYDGPADSSDSAGAIALDAFGNVYVTGYSTGIGTGYDCTTLKYFNPVPVMQELIELVESFNLQQGIANSLDGKLQNVLDALVAANAGKRQDAINKLEAFINAVEAQRAKELTNEQADILINETDAIIELLL